MDIALKSREDLTSEDPACALPCFGGEGLES